MGEEKSFESYLREIGSHISNQRRRAEVEEELSGHLEEKKEFLMIRGLSQEEAEQRVLEEMGDGEALSRTLGILHSALPRDEQGKLFRRLIAGFLMSMVFVDLWYWDMLLPSLGSLLLVWAFYRLSAAGSRFRTGYLASVGFALWQAGKHILYSLPGLEPWRKEIKGIWIAATCLWLVFLLWLLFTGFQKLAGKMEAYPMSARLSNGPWYYIGSIGLAFLTAALFASYLDYAEELLTSIVIGVPLVGILATLLRIRDIQDWVWEQEILLPLRPSSRRENGIGIALLVCLFLLPMGIQAGITFQPPREIRIEAEGGEALHVRAEQVREQIGAYNPSLNRENLTRETFLDWLPDSEIIKYEGAQDIAAGRCYDGAESWAMVFQMPDNRLRVMYVKCFSFEEDEDWKLGYRNVVMLRLLTQNWQFAEEPEVFIRCAQGDKTVFQAPLSQSLGEYASGFSYRVPAGGQKTGCFVYMGAVIENKPGDTLINDIRTFLQLGSFPLQIVEYEQRELFTSPICGSGISDPDVRRAGYRKSELSIVK